MFCMTSYKLIQKSCKFKDRGRFAAFHCFPWMILCFKVLNLGSDNDHQVTLFNMLSIS